MTSCMAAIAPSLLNVVLIAVLLTLIAVGDVDQSKAAVALAWGIAAACAGDEWLSDHPADVAVADILRFVDDERAVRAAVGQLVEDGYLEALGNHGASVRYRLTATGIHEGRRRFLDEFEPYLARHAHGECGSADCDCRRGGTECRGTV